MSSWSESRLRKHLRTRYDRVTIQQVCAAKNQNYEPQDLAVWVRADREWTKLPPSRVQELWHTNTKARSRSFCRFVSRDLLKLSSKEYVGVKRSLESVDSEELAGIYKAREPGDDEYALVIEFPASSSLVKNLLIAGASVGGVLAAGAIAKQVRSKYASQTPDASKLPLVADDAAHQTEVAKRQSELTALSDEIDRKKTESARLTLHIHEIKNEEQNFEKALQDFNRRRSEMYDVIVGLERDVQQRREHATNAIQRTQSEVAQSERDLQNSRQDELRLEQQLADPTRRINESESQLEHAQREASRLRDETQRSEAEFARLEAERNQTADERQAIQEELDQARDELHRLGAERDRLRQDEATLAALNERIRTAQTESARENEKLRATTDETTRLRLLETRLGQSVQNLQVSARALQQTIQSELSDVRQKSTELKEEKAKILEDVEKARSNMAQSEERMQTFLREMAKQVEKLESEQTRSQRSIKRLSQEEIGLDRAVSSKRKELEASQGQLDRFGSMIEQLQREINAKTRERQASEVALSSTKDDYLRKKGGMDAELVSLQSQKAELEENVANLSQEQDRLQREIGEVRDIVINVTAERATLESDIRERSEIATAVQRDLEQKESELNQLMEDAQKSRQEKDELAAELGELQLEIVASQENNTGLDAYTKELERDNRAAAERNEILEASFNEMLVRYDDMLKQNKKFGTLENLDSELETLRSKKTALAREIDAMESIKRELKSKGSVAVLPTEAPEELVTQNRALRAEASLANQNYESLQAEHEKLKRDQAESIHEREEVIDNLRSKLGKLHTDQSKVRECQQLTSVLGISTADDLRSKLNVDSDDAIKPMFDKFVDSLKNEPEGVATFPNPAEQYPDDWITEASPDSLRAVLRLIQETDRSAGIQRPDLDQIAEPDLRAELLRRIHEEPDQLDDFIRTLAKSNEEVESTDTAEST